MTTDTVRTARLSTYSRTATVAITPIAILASGAKADVYSQTGLSIAISANSGTGSFDLTGPGGVAVVTVEFGGYFGYCKLRGNDLGWMGINQRSSITRDYWYGGLPVAAGATWNNPGRTAGQFTGNINSIQSNVSYGNINLGTTTGGDFNDDPMGLGDTGQTWYLLFRMSHDVYTDNYGWLSFDAYDGDLPYITITGWGWDDTGSTIAAGATSGSTAVPGLGGLAALALGAGGLRGRRQRGAAS